LARQYRAERQQRPKELVIRESLAESAADFFFCGSGIEAFLVSLSKRDHGGSFRRTIRHNSDPVGADRRLADGQIGIDVNVGCEPCAFLQNFSDGVK
jgi:hypothetical protein